MPLHEDTTWVNERAMALRSEEARWAAWRELGVRKMSPHMHEADNVPLWAWCVGIIAIGVAFFVFAAIVDIRLRSSP